MRHSTKLWATSMATLLLVIPSAWAQVDSESVQNETTLVSRASGPAGDKANNEFSIDSSISADGRYVAFRSDATNLHPDDADFFLDVFVRDLQTHETILVSRATGRDGDKSNGRSSSPNLSADGRYVAFDTDATNLDPDDVDTILDVFVRDLRTRRTILVSRATGPHGDKGNRFSVRPSLSAGGRYIAFDSGATNLHPDDADGTADVFVRDWRAHKTILVSRATGQDGDKGNRDSVVPSISADGRFIALQSDATNLHPDDVDPTADVFVRDVQTHETILVSRATGPDGDNGNRLSGSPSISADGRFIAFFSFASNLHPDDTDDVGDVFVRDRHTDETILVSRATGPDGEKGDSFSGFPSISADGRYVAYRSDATNLHPDDADGGVVGSDVFVRDLQTHETILVSRATGPDGNKGNGASLAPSISAEDRYIAFESVATNLHPDDTDDAHDVFVRDVLGPP